MYSYGSSGRVAGGKRGHGGRNYRAPPPRRDPNSTPPPLKECSCLIEMFVPEYGVALAQGESRSHATFFGSRERLDQCTKVMRSEYLTHMMVPGRKQQGPISVVGRTYHEALAGVAWLLACCHANVHSLERSSIRGRIMKNVKDSDSNAVEGQLATFHGTDSDKSFQVYWLFQSSSWSVLAVMFRNSGEVDCTESEGKTPPMSSGMPIIAQLKLSVDNVVFRMGTTALGGLDMFTDHPSSPTAAFAAGPHDQALLLYEELASMR